MKAGYCVSDGRTDALRTEIFSGISRVVDVSTPRTNRKDQPNSLFPARIVAKSTSDVQRNENSKLPEVSDIRSVEAPCFTVRE